MTKSVYIFFIFFTASLFVNSQTISIIDDLNTPKAGQGKITIYQDDAVKNLLGSSIQGPTIANPINQLDGTNNGAKYKNFLKTKGYRIQVYSGSDQRRSKNEAQSRKNVIQSSFPNMEVSVIYNSPIWRVKAGNFKTREQAVEALTEMKNRLPSFGREMYIINDVIKIPVE